MRRRLRLLGLLSSSLLSSSLLSSSLLSSSPLGGRLLGRGKLRSRLLGGRLLGRGTLRGRLGSRLLGRCLSPAFSAAAFSAAAFSAAAFPAAASRRCFLPRCAPPHAPPPGHQRPLSAACRPRATPPRPPAPPPPPAPAPSATRRPTARPRAGSRAVVAGRSPCCSSCCPPSPCPCPCLCPRVQPGRPPRGMLLPEPRMGAPAPTVRRWGLQRFQLAAAWPRRHRRPRAAACAAEGARSPETRCTRRPRLRGVLILLYEQAALLEIEPAVLFAEQDQLCAQTEHFCLRRKGGAVRVDSLRVLLSRHLANSCRIFGRYFGTSPTSRGPRRAPPA